MITTDEIIHLVQSSGKSMLQVAKDAKTSPQTLYHWRNQDRSPTIDVVERVLNAVGFTLVVREVNDDD